MPVNSRAKGASAKRRYPVVVDAILPGELWTEITANDGMFFGRYQVSNLGRVRAHPEARIGGSRPGRVLFQGRDECGYPQVYLHYGDQRKKTIKVHRLVAEGFLGVRPAGFQVNHINGNKADNTVANLEYVSSAENVRHAVKVIQGSGVIVFGQLMTISEAVEKFAVQGLSEQAVRRRIRRLGWSIEKAITTPIQPSGRPFGGRLA